MTDFLPSGYEVPASDSNYMRLEKGTNRFRIITPPILGMEYWKTIDDKRTPIRKKTGVNIPVDELEINEDTGKPDMPKHFWAMVVWNVKTDKAQILEITQKRIQKAIRAMSQSEDWGNPTEYDIEIEREGEKFETTYTVRPCPKKKFDEGKLQMVKDLNINLDALFESGDPFAGEKLDVDEIDEKLKVFQEKK